jgi:hypothetical protein
MERFDVPQHGQNTKFRVPDRRLPVPVPFPLPLLPFSLHDRRGSASFPGSFQEAPFQGTSDHRSVIMLWWCSCTIHSLATGAVLNGSSTWQQLVAALLLSPL